MTEVALPSRTQSLKAAIVFDRDVDILQIKALIIPVPSSPRILNEILGCHKEMMSLLSNIIDIFKKCHVYFRT